MNRKTPSEPLEVGDPVALRLFPSRLYGRIIAELHGIRQPWDYAVKLFERRDGGEPTGEVVPVLWSEIQHYQGDKPTTEAEYRQLYDSREDDLDLEADYMEDTGYLAPGQASAGMDGK